MTAPLNDWDDIAAYHNEHCHKCRNYLPELSKATGAARCRLTSGTNCTFAIETGKCHYEEA